MKNIVSDAEYMEMIVIGSILTHPDIFPSVADVVKPRDFVCDSAVKCWGAIASNYSASDNKDLYGKVYVSLPNDIDKQWFFRCTTDIVPLKSSVASTAKKIAELARARRITAELAALTSKAKSTTTPDHILEDLLSLYRRENGEVDQDVSIGSVIERFKAVQEKYRAQGSVGKRTGFELLNRDFIVYQPGHLWVIGGWTSSGKAQPGSSTILSPTGRIRFDEVNKGDVIFTSSGGRQIVEEVFPQGEKDVFEITFSDGRKARCCIDHLWKYRAKDRRWTIGPLVEIMSRGKCQRLNIPICGPLEYSKKQLPIDPFLMGVLLGDGSFRNSSVRITNPGEKLMSIVESKLPEGDKLKRNDEIEYSIIKSFYEKGVASKTMLEIEKFGLRNLYSHEKIST